MSLVHTSRLVWTLNLKTLNNNSKLKLKLDDRFFKKYFFGPRLSENADKKDRVLQGPHAQIKEINSVAKNVIIINMV